MWISRENFELLTRQTDAHRHGVGLAEAWARARTATLETIAANRERGRLAQIIHRQRQVIKRLKAAVGEKER